MYIHYYWVSYHKQNYYHYLYCRLQIVLVCGMSEYCHNNCWHYLLLVIVVLNSSVVLVSDSITASEVVVVNLVSALRSSVVSIAVSEVVVTIHVISSSSSSSVVCDSIFDSATCVSSCACTCSRNYNRTYCLRHYYTVRRRTLKSKNQKSSARADPKMITYTQIMGKKSFPIIYNTSNSNIFHFKEEKI